jgi:hypothetical protein
MIHNNICGDGCSDLACSTGFDCLQQLNRTCCSNIIKFPGKFALASCCYFNSWESLRHEFITPDLTLNDILLINNVLSVCVLETQFIYMLLFSINTDDLFLMTFISYFVNILLIKIILIHLLQPQLALFWNFCRRLLTRAVYLCRPRCGRLRSSRMFLICIMIILLIILYLMAVFSLIFPGSVPIRMFI